MAPYLVAVLLAFAAVLVGAAVCRACGTTTAVAAPVGLAALIALAALGVRLPGGATTSALLCGAAVLVAGAALLRGAARPRVDLVAVLAGASALAIVSLQFVSAGRIGLPGMSLNNDTAVHLLWAEGLRSDLMRTLYISNPGYPLGPHALMATLAQATGADMDAVLTALLLATPVLVAIAAAALLRPMPWGLRWGAASFAAVPYLMAAWFAQGAFKEPLMALLLLGFTGGLGAVLPSVGRLPRTAFVPLGLVVAGSLLTYSYLAIAWLGAATVLMVVLAVVAHRPGVSSLLAAGRAAVVPVTLGVGAAALAAGVELPRLWRYLTAVGASPAGGGAGIDASSLGNLAGPLQARAMVGEWPARDFRFPPPPDAFLHSQLATLGLVALVVAVVLLLVRRRALPLLAGLGAAGAMWLLSDRTQSPYVTAKSMVIVAPFIALVTLRALIPDAMPATWRGRGLAAIGVLTACILVAGGLWSSQRVLRSSPVESAPQRDQLESLRPFLGHRPTLFLGVDDYAGWRLRGVPLAYFGVGFPPPIGPPASPQKPFSYGADVDWDSAAMGGLDRFDYVITLNSPYMSAAPSSFRPVKRTPLYVLWRRVGKTQPRLTADPPDGPATWLDCGGDANARRLVRAGGVASVLRPRPITLQGALPPLGTGASFSFTTRLPAGDWTLAVKYTSAQPVRIMYGSARVAELPANTTRPGGWWPGGTLTSTGRAQQVVVIAERESRLSDTAFPASISGVVATRPGPEKVIPLRRACGQVVDWYRRSRG